ncbi:MAG: hypothetical protein ACXACC_05200 [Promethearchaeota archaeon]
MSECTVCGKSATATCARCGKPLCSEHIKYGVNLRTNSPTINCPGCKKEQSKNLKLTLTISTIIFIIIAVVIILYLNSIFGFF